MTVIMARNNSSFVEEDDNTTSYDLPITDATTTQQQSDLIYEGIVTFIGLFGTLANGLVMSVLIYANRQKRKATNSLIINQLSIDLFSCVSIVVTYAVKLRNYYHVGRWGDLLCQIVTNEWIIWVGLNADIASLCFITLERYAKVVHSLIHRKYFRKWMISVAIALSWVIGFFANTPVMNLTSAVVDGVCFSAGFFPTRQSIIAYGIIYFIVTFLGPLILFVYSYGHIVFIIRKQAAIHTIQTATPGLSAPGNATQKNTTRSRMNVIKVMIMIITFFALCWMPSQVYYLLMNLQFPLDMLANTWYVLEALVLLNVVANPFIYASQYDIIKNRIGKMLRCRHEQDVDQPTAELTAAAP